MYSRYVFSVLNYGCESWTWNKPMRMKVNAFERWCYRMILGIRCRDHVSTPEVMKRVQIELQTELHFTKDMIKRKISQDRSLILLPELLYSNLHLTFLYCYLLMCAYSGF